jgi:hypothetical protein
MIMNVRTTVDIDDDVLQAAKEIASRRGTTAGRVISELLREALSPAAPAARVRNGVPLLPPRASGTAPLTMKVVNELRDA